ncbi:MAG: MerR family transcriptional regulator [Spirochaetes bacterium]|nr:MerR family transcriptional regulator [Spirochaetota bacterium]
MYSIGQFSTITKIPCKTLRYYDEIGLLKPAMTDDDNNYRYYDHNSVLQAQQILIYRNCGMPLEKIRELLEETKDKENLYEILITQLSVLDQKINETHTSRSRLEEIIKSLEGEKMYPVELIIKEDQHVISMRQRGNHETISAILSKLFETAAVEKLTIAGPHTIIWHEEKDFSRDDVDMEIYVPIENSAGVSCGLFQKMPAGDFCRTMYKGSMTTLSSAYERIYDFISKNHYIITGPFRETYSSRMGFINPNEMEIELSVPVIQNAKGK